MLNILQTQCLFSRPSCTVNVTCYLASDWSSWE